MGIEKMRKQYFTKYNPDEYQEFVKPDKYPYLNLFIFMVVASFIGAVLGITLNFIK